MQVLGEEAFEIYVIAEDLVAVAVEFVDALQGKLKKKGINFLK